MSDDWTLADHIEAIASILTDASTCPTPPLDVNSGLIMNMLDAAAELRRLTAVDDATRQEVEAIEWALRHVPTAVGPGVRSRAAELLAAAYLGRND